MQQTTIKQTENGGITVTQITTPVTYPANWQMLLFVLAYFTAVSALGAIIFAPFVYFFGA